MTRATISSLLAALLLMQHSAFAADGITLTRHGNLADVDIVAGIAVADALQALAESYGAEVKGAAPEASIGPVHLVDATLPQALAAVLPNRSFMVKYDQLALAPQLIVLMQPSAHAGGAAPPLAPLPEATSAAVMPPPGEGPGAMTAQQRAACLMRRSHMKPGGQNGGGQPDPEGNPCLSPQLPGPEPQ